MNGGFSQSARVLAATDKGYFYDRLPPDTSEDKATQLWRLACHFEVADPYVIELNREALAEAHARLSALLGEG